MNVIKKFAAVVALGLVSFGSFAAQDIGTVQVSGAETLSVFEAQVTDLSLYSCAVHQTPDPVRPTLFTRIA